MTTAPNPASAVVLSSVSKLYGRFAALRQVSISFQTGRLYAVFGDNGAGKSTLLRVLAGLIEPSSGTVEILGARDLRQVTGRLGYMAHASLLYDELSGMENLAHASLLYDELSGMENLRYFAGLYGIRGNGRGEEVMRLVGLDPSLGRYVGQYSQGMRQRLSMARALLNDPELLLLDEPFSNVDVHSARHMADLLAQLRDRGKTIFVVTHQVMQLDGLADESVLMDAGRVAARRPGIEAAPPVLGREVRA